MKKPVRVAAIEIVVSGGDMGKPFKARSSQFKQTATSAIGPRYAANNLAVRWFFDGHTHAHGVGAEEQQAVQITETGEGRFIGTINLGGVA